MAEVPAPAPVDPRLIQWLAVQALHDRDARLVDGGGDADDRIELARLFIDLPVAFAPNRGRVPRQNQTGMTALLGALAKEGEGPHTLLVGGPGSGKSTLTTMLAQALRRPWLDANLGHLSATLRKHWEAARGELAALASRLEWPAVGVVLPLRVNLPSLARWMASHRDGSEPLLWQHLATRAAEELAAHDLTWEVTAAQLRQVVGDAGPVVWILDGLDEVPHTAGRAEVVQAVRAVVCERATKIAGVVVATRPQGYEGEFDELDAITLLPLPAELARDYGERLIRAWAQRAGAMDVHDRLDALRSEFAKPEVEALLQTPLHTTIAAVLVASRETLPKSRYRLFEEYFRTVLRRELKKPNDHKLVDEDEGILRTLHVQAGLLLHVRAQAKMGARSSLRRRELGELLAAIYGGQGYEGDERRAKVERLLRFAAERLVLLIHDVQGEYSFGVRSLQEFFAAEALMEGDVADVAKRLDAVVRSTHWSNVVAFVVSRHALATSPSERATALRLTVERCTVLNRGNAGEPAVRCLLGSHLALAMLREVQRYAGPWLQEELWKVAFEAAPTPTQEDSAREVVLEGHRERRLGASWWDSVEIHVRLGMTAAGSAGDGGARWRNRVYEAAELLFARGGESALIAWRLLWGLLAARDRQASDIATRYAPTTRVEAWAAYNAGALGPEVVLPVWWCDYLNDHPEWFTPSLFSPRARFIEAQHPVAALGVAARLVGQATRMGAKVEDPQAYIIWCSLNRLPSLPATMPEVSPSWCAWRRVAAFFDAPCATSLASVVDTLADSIVLRELYSFVEFFPWPLAACLEYALDRGGSDELAHELRGGSLGDIDDWLAADHRLCVGAPLSNGEWESLWTAQHPWPSGIGASGTPIPTRFGNGIADSLQGWIVSHPNHASMVLRLLARRDRIHHGSREFHELADEQLLRDEALRQDPWQFGIRLQRDESTPDRWLELLERRGRHGLNTATGLYGSDAGFWLPRLFTALRDLPERWGLLDAIVSLLYALPNLALDDRTLPRLPADASPRAIAQHALVTLCSGHFTPFELPALFDRLIWNDGAPRDLRVELAQALQLRDAGEEPSTDLLLAALDASPPPTPEARDALLGALFAHARRLTPPAFASSDAWLLDHHLPPPFLSGQAPPRLPPVLVSIDALRNVRLFTDTPTVDAPFSRPPNDRGQWIVLVGENGVGKTTLLRALALTIAPPAVASKLLDERLQLVRNGEAARVAVTLDTGRREVVIRREERTEVIEPVVTAEGEPPWVVAYGVRRGNALGEKDRPPELGPVGDLHTLFERPAALYPAAQWLRDLDGDVLREQRRSPRKDGAPPGPREAAWQAAVKALHTILGVTEVAVEEGGGVYVTHPEFGRVSFEAMSDGYLGTAGWLIDMIARWIDRQQALDEPVGPNVLRQMCGLALIDELDLHLHPVWQLRIIEEVRKLFPRMSFVVTTHNPLALQGARAGEVFVMRREGVKVELVQRDIRPGQDVDRVLFEQFGVKHTLDRDTRDLLDQHRRMVEEGVAPDDPDRRRLEARLVERFGDVGSTVRDERAAEDASPLRPDEQGLIDELLKDA